MGLLDFDTVSLDEAAGELVLIDQTLLPGKTQWLRLTQAEDIFEAILSLRVRGAPAIGVAAAIGLYVCALRIKATDAGEFRAQVHAVKAYLASARPTAVNLTWALNRMEGALPASGSVADLKEALLKEARAIRDEDIAVCRKLGENGLTLLKDGDGILTHCNAGQLAAVRYGTALAPIHVGREQGLHFRMFCDETRPLLQGARLSAYEMMEAGMETTVLCDNMAASLLSSGQVQAVIVGCDRVAANGDAANKIGTMGLAILAKRFEIPFYVAAPTSTIDFACPDGQHIVIEQRAPEEVTRMWYREPMAPAGVQAYNPAFDVTPHELITAIITEHGVLRPSYSDAIAKLPGSVGLKKEFDLS